MKRLARRLIVCYAAVIALILYTPITEWLAWPLYVAPTAASPADAIVVMEAWAFDDGELNESGMRRTVRALELYRQGTSPTIVITGSAPRSDRNGSALAPMARLLTLGGVPPESIILESASRNTHESAVNVAALARLRSWKHLVLVTDAVHMRRARGSFHKEGVAVATASTWRWDLFGAQPTLRLKRVGALLHEYGGLLYYRARGWL